MAAMPKPELVFRLGFAGNRELPKERIAALREVLSAVYEVIGARLKEIAPGVPVAGHAEALNRFYADRPPQLRLITGLAEGADALAMQVFLQRPDDEHLSCEAAAVLPFDVDTYRRSRDATFLTEFDQLEQQSAYLLQLDGIYDKPTRDTAAAKRRRTRGYRAQATLLLRQCDVMLVIADPDAEGKAGGTLETIQRALDCEIPVLLIDAQTAQVVCIEPQDELDERLAASAGGDDSDAAWRQRVRQWVTALVAGPHADPQLPPDKSSADGSQPPGDGTTTAGEELLAEFFDADSKIPPTRAGGGRRVSLRERCWRWFLSRFQPADPITAPTDPPLEPYAVFCRRASELNAYYSGLYRGTFVLNYLFAVLVVTIAAFSLLLMGEQHSEAVQVIAKSWQWRQADDSIDVEPSPTGGEKPPVVGDGEQAGEVHLGLLGLAALKLRLVFAIFYNTGCANRGGWNDKAIDCRYLVERLRMSSYLPLVGSFRPSVAAQPQFASSVLRQSSIDWLLDAIVRAVSPGDIQQLADAESPADQMPVRLRIRPAVALDAIRDKWLQGQIAYHGNNALTMNGMHVFVDRASRLLTTLVVLVVAVDVSILLCNLLGLLPGLTVRLQPFAPFLVFASAVSPAAVASLNGLRFQTECRRLADRSDVMHRLLQRNQQAAGAMAANIAAQLQAPEADLGSWTPSVLRLSENIARDMIEEVGEWSVIYAKELAEP